MRRREFRPGISDRLEERVVLSRPPSLVGTVAAKMRPVALKIGTMGDSLTDEYRFNVDRRGAKNFVEILSATRRLRFGMYTTMNRAAPRSAGFTNNWASVGATSDDMIRNQLPGLSDQVRKGQVNLVSILIGANDFIRYATSVSPLSPPSAEQVSASLAKVQNRLQDNLTTAVRTLMAANPNVKLAISTLPDLKHLPAAASMAANPLLRPTIDAVSGAIGAYNAKVKAFAAEDPAHIAVVDLSAQYAQIAAASATTGKFNVGGQSIDTRTPSNDPSHFFLADGVHMGTVGQGLFANLFIQTVDAKFQVSIKPLKPSEVLRQAKLS